MALTLTAKALANAVAGTDYIAAIIDPVVTSKVFSNVAYTVGANLPALGGSNFTVEAPYSNNGGTANASLPKLPQLQALSAVSATDGAGNTQMGYLKVTLAFDAADVVNASSPGTITFSPNALAITATSSS